MFRYLMMVLVLLPSLASAEIYRWVDDQGEVHFSDKKPDQGEAKEVSADLGPINRDSSSGETRKLGKLFNDETPEERAYRLNKQNQEQAEVDRACISARNNLRKLRGRFYMTGKDGKEIVVDEDQQKAMIENLEEQIKKRCS